MGFALIPKRRRGDVVLQRQITPVGTPAQRLVSISAFTEIDGPMSGVKTTSIGTRALKFRACTTIVGDGFFCAESNGRLIGGGGPEPSAMAVPATSMMSSRGLSCGKTVMKEPRLIGTVLFSLTNARPARSSFPAPSRGWPDLGSFTGRPHVPQNHTARHPHRLH